jgi:hypothetical protein
MSETFKIDESGKIIVNDGTLMPEMSAHPVWKARVSLALPKSKWLYAPDNGHELDKYQNMKASEQRIQEFEKEVKFYLQPYGPQTVDRFTSRGAFSIETLITRETISNE